MQPHLLLSKHAEEQQRSFCVKMSTIGSSTVLSSDNLIDNNFQRHLDQFGLNHLIQLTNVCMCVCILCCCQHCEFPHYGMNEGLSYLILSHLFLFTIRMPTQ